MRIALCDDDAACNAALKKYIEEYMFGSNTDLSVGCFTSASALLNEDKYDLYFLDFIMPEMSGADLAVKLREKFCNAVTVCFLTSRRVQKYIYSPVFGSLRRKQESFCLSGNGSVKQGKTLAS